MDYRNKDFIYDSETGEMFHARDKAPNAKAGQLCAPNSLKKGYKVTELDGKQLYQHRIAWFLVHGEWPKEIDHINHVRSDNRLCNLRPVTRIENHQNQRMPSNNMSSCIGVTFKHGKWCAAITVNYRTIYLGVFDDWHGAFNKRKTAEVEYGFHPNHGRER